MLGGGRGVYQVESVSVFVWARLYGHSVVPVSTRRGGPEKPIVILKLGKGQVNGLSWFTGCPRVGGGGTLNFFLISLLVYLYFFPMFFSMFFFELPVM